MKKIVFSLVAAVIALSSIAQKPADKKEYKMERKEVKGHHAVNDLNLTTDQKRQLKIINDDFKQQMQSLKINTTATAKEQKEKREALVKEHQQKVDAILTPEQRLKAEDFKNVSKAHGPHHAKGKDGEDRLDKLTKDLDLTTDQQTKYKAINENLRSEVKNIETNNALTDGQKKEQLKNIRKKHNEDLQALLTSEQKAKLKIRMKNQPNRKAVK